MLHMSWLIHHQLRLIGYSILRNLFKPDFIKYTIIIPLFCLAIAKPEDSNQKPCLEDMLVMEFELKGKTENSKFGPINNRYKAKTTAQLIAETSWMNADNAGPANKSEIEAGSEEEALINQHEKNLTELVAFEEYKEDMINK